MKVKDLKPAGYNPRKISPEKLAALKKAMEEFGDLSGIVFNARTQTVIGGHQRIKNLDPSWPIIKKAQTDKTGTTAAGYVETPHGRLTYREVDWPEIKEKQANIAANKHSGEFDDELLAELLKEIKTEDTLLDFSLIGFDDEEMANLLGAAKEPRDAEPQIDRAEELNKTWGVKTGDLWQIGEHRLLCGDSTKKEDVGRVMGEERAVLCFTSPPYGNARDYEIGEFDYMALYKNFSELAFSVCDNTVVNLGLIHKDGRVFRYWDEWINYCESKGDNLFGWYVWDQGSGMPGDYHGRLARCHEWIFHFSKNHNSANKFVKTTGESKKRGTSGKRFRQKDGSLKAVGSPETIGQDYKIPDSVVRIQREMARGIHTESHPAVFPLEFPSFGIQTWSKENETIYEPFCGSGTTMVACQNLNRKCRGIEISENYCAVILQRMTDAFPGIEIKRIER